MALNRFSAWSDLLAATGILLAATLVAALCLAPLFALFPGLEREVMMIAVYTVQFTLAIVGTALWYRHSGGGRLRFGASWSAAPMILLGVLTVTAAGVVLEPLLNLFPERYFEQLNDLIGRGGAAILLTVVAAPVLEEMFFRGLVLEQLSRRWSAGAAVMASSLLFGAVHLPNLPQMVNAFIVAGLMGYIYLATRSLVPVIVIHAINNGAAYMFMQLTGTQSTDTREMVGNDTVYWVVYATSAAILAIAFAAMAGRVRTKKDEITLNPKTTE